VNVERLRRIADANGVALWNAIVSARAAGVPLRAIAEASGLSKSELHRRLAGGEGGRQ